MIDPKHYIPVNSPYPAHLFASSHPLRQAEKTDLRKLFKKQRTTAPVKRIHLKDKTGA